MTNKIFTTFLIAISINVCAQTSTPIITKETFRINWETPTACSDFKRKYPTTKIPGKDVPEELRVIAPEKHFPGADLIQVFCVPNQIISIHVRVPKFREDGADLATLYEELSRAYELDVVQPKEMNGTIKSTFTAGKVRVHLTDKLDSNSRSVTFFGR